MRILLLALFLSISSFEAAAVEEPNSTDIEVNNTSVSKVLANKSPSLDPVSTLPASSRTSEYEPMSSWPVVIGTLFMMIACIVGLAWFARRFNGFNMTRNREMEVLSTLPVGAREKITLVKVKGQTLLLGVTSHQISRLHAFESDDDEMLHRDEQSAGKTFKSEFSATLKGLMSGDDAAKDIPSSVSHGEQK